VGAKERIAVARRNVGVDFVAGIAGMGKLVRVGAEPRRFSS
jgi:hypothetical protein